MSIDKGQFAVAENVMRFNSRAVKKGLKIRILCECRNRRLLFMYNEKMLAKHLENENVKAVFKRFGYCEKMSIDEYLDRLAMRIMQAGDFPHEVGLFLGYPVDDVLGFIENKGENYKLCGYWKVYSDEKYAKRTFDNYNKCRKYLCEKLNEGEDIYSALKIS